MAKSIKVLSIDGGGVYGLSTAMMLEEIERRTGKSIAEMFDLVAGTSSGGITALGLTVAHEGKPKFTAAAVVDLYKSQIKEIFSRSFLHKLFALGNLIDEKYPSTGIDTV